MYPTIKPKKNYHTSFNFSLNYKISYFSKYGKGPCFGRYYYTPSFYNILYLTFFSSASNGHSNILLVSLYYKLTLVT